ncbi:MAG TPA: PQQ-binding-like beta-propeller repeat protein [Polyangiaceae bacterium]|nr:PQQ-binding-like beta-propeller repeat protein [Polyangiaceae bacterium]
MAFGIGCREPETADWPALGYNARSTYNNTFEKTLTTANANRLGAIWQSGQYGTVNGSPAVVAGVIYVLSSTGTFAVRANDGQEIWRNTNVKGTSSAMYSNGQLYVHDTEAVLYALNASNGSQIWRIETDPHPNARGFASPRVFDNYVIVGVASAEGFLNTTETSTFRGSVIAYNRTTGAQVWRRYTVDPPHNGAGVWSSVSIDERLGLVYGTTGNNYLGTASLTSDSIFALRLGDGTPVWWTQLTKNDVYTNTYQNGPDADFGTNPLLFEATINGFPRELVGAGQKAGMFYALDRRTGAVVWSRNVSPGSLLVGGMMNAAAFDGQRILLAGNRGSSTGPGSEPANGESSGLVSPSTAVLEALNPSNGSVIWERQLPAWVWAPITVANGIGFVAYEKQLQAFDVRNGNKLFSYRTNGTISSSPVVANGAVYFGSGLSYIATHADQTLHALALDGSFIPDAGTDSGAGATFSAVYDQVLFGAGCASAFCHGASAGNLAMGTRAQAYHNLVNVNAAGDACASSGRKRVEPGNPDASLLVHKISNATPECGTVMPPGPGVTLTQAQIDLVRAWIAAGAPDN